MAAKFAIKKCHKKATEPLPLSCDECGCRADEVIRGLTYDKKGLRAENKHVTSEQ